MSLDWNVAEGGRSWPPSEELVEWALEQATLAQACKREGDPEGAWLYLMRLEGRAREDYQAWQRRQAPTPPQPLQELLDVAGVLMSWPGGVSPGLSFRRRPPQPEPTQHDLSRLQAARDKRQRRTLRRRGER